MANNKIFVSPGVYTKEVNLATAAASIGATSLGVVGETLKGPAFEPVLVTNQNEFRAIFGTQSPEKVSNGNYKYELAYIANSYLEQSNQLYVTRVLGKKGYVATKAYIIKSGTNVLGVLRATVKSNGTPNTLTLVGTGTNFSTVKLDANTEFSLNKSDANYIERVLGTNPIDDLNKVYIERLFLNGNTTSGAVTITEVASLSNFETSFKTPETPFIISDLRGGNKNMFKFISISDGESGNYEIKISIENINTKTREFDVLVRSYGDTDAKPNILEAFRRCTMDPSSVSYIGRRIGTQDGLYTLNSKHVMVEIDPTATIDLIPGGFKGYKTFSFGSDTVNVSFKSEFDAETKVKKQFLGFKSVDTGLLKYTGTDSGSLTPDFKMEDGIATLFDDNDAEDIAHRKFTVGLAGGFDGWDILTNERSYNTPASDDYNAYLDGINIFGNPDEVAINLFATAGIDFYNHRDLVNEAIEMIEDERRDALYVVNSPNNLTDVEDGAEVYANNLADALESVEIDSSYVATYGAWIHHYDTQNGVNVYLPPTFEVLRNMAEVDRREASWFAVAGFDNGKLQTSKSLFKLNIPASDTLYNGRINPIRTFSGSPLLIFGNKTLLNDENSPLNRINIRRLLLQIQKLVAVVAVRLVFQPNDKELQLQFKRLVEPILEDVRKMRGLISAEVICDETNNTNADRDQLQLNGYIRIKPTLATEYINITYGVTDQGASFG